jgi:AcrR family transcriptional regulator
MAAATKFTESAILDAAEQVIACSGVDGASIAAIARACGAPNGSIYHRFPSRQHLIGALWVRIADAYRSTLTGAIHAPDTDLAETVVTHTFRWVAENPARAELLMRFRTEDFTPGDWPADVIEQIAGTNAALATELLLLAQRLNLNPLDVTMAIIDIPAAAARRALLLRNPAVSTHLQQRAIELSRILLERVPFGSGG